MTTAREVMHSGCECMNINENLATVARRMAELDIGAMPVCGDDNRLKGMVTDRDIVVKAVAQGKDPAQVKAGDILDGGTVWWVDPGTDVEEVLHEMAEHRIRRLPVLENEELVGIISQPDLAAKLPKDKIGELVETISGSSH
ncbi:CBS domain-containing protein [Actinoallomurus oryzae]|uniref:CBS domain-containing protein n=2 Tax=Actinoallomurus TaxID=667113 RepID=A0ABP8QQ51_9ACTN